MLNTNAEREHRQQENKEMLIEIEEKNQAIVKLEEIIESAREDRQSLESEIEQMNQAMLNNQQALDMK
jgi:aconitase B